MATGRHETNRILSKEQVGRSLTSPVEDEPLKLPGSPLILYPEAPIPKIKNTDKVPAMEKLSYYTNTA